MKCIRCDRELKTGYYYIDGLRVCQTCKLHWRFDHELGFRERYLAAQRAFQLAKRLADPQKSRADQRLRRQNKPDVYRERKRRWLMANPVRQLLIGARARAKRYGLDFELTEADVVWADTCPVLGLKLQVGHAKVQRNSPTLDRIDNTRGYVHGNVRVISFRANSLKSDATPEELEAILLDLRRQSFG